ncbi:hypothetical protein [Blastochloris sulfoviridis]|nr:hypothetical protein [Blastochloris sulfoviridis]
MRNVLRAERMPGLPLSFGRAQSEPRYFAEAEQLCLDALMEPSLQTNFSP